MNERGEIDQFQLLEEKIDSLIGLITQLRKERGLLTEKARIQNEKLTDLTEQIEEMKTTRDEVKQRVVYLLEKIEKIDIL